MAGTNDRVEAQGPESGAGDAPEFKSIWVCLNELGSILLRCDWNEEEQRYLVESFYPARSYDPQSGLMHSNEVSRGWVDRAVRIQKSPESKLQSCEEGYYVYVGDSTHFYHIGTGPFRRPSHGAAVSSSSGPNPGGPGQAVGATDVSAGPASAFYAPMFTPASEPGSQSDSDRAASGPQSDAESDGPGNDGLCADV